MSSNKYIFTGPGLELVITLQHAHKQAFKMTTQPLIGTGTEGTEELKSPRILPLLKKYPTGNSTQSTHPNAIYMPYSFMTSAIVR